MFSSKSLDKIFCQSEGAAKPTRGFNHGKYAIKPFNRDLSELSLSGERSLGMKTVRVACNVGRK